MPPKVEELRAPVSRASTNERSPSQPSLTAEIAASIDPGRVSQYVNEFQTRNQACFDRLTENPSLLPSLFTIFGLSRFLSEEALRHPEWIFALDDPRQPCTLSDYNLRLQSFLSGRKKPTALDLALFRRKELLRIVVRDGLGLASITQLTGEISDLADTILTCALEAAKAELEPRYGLPLTSDGEGSNVVAQFTVVALGKLGGRELNYSSDVDLMFLYSGNGDTSGPQSITNKEFFKKLANQFTSLLSAYTAAGVCYRVDLRLRPEGSLGDVCISLAGARDYYSQRARDWELQMLIKARVAAGDQLLGQEFLDFVEPSIYSTTLDFNTIETMSATRERISEKLARKRLRQDQLDVKLAPGGIRDIEFLVQCLQRLHGAREFSVRHGGTLFALASLRDKDLLSESEYRRLADAYEFLRDLEHRLQLEDDRQTHTLPSEPYQLERVARRMPPAGDVRSRMSNATQLLQTLNQHLEEVQVIYDRIVHAQRPLYYKPITVEAIPFNIPPPGNGRQLPQVELSKKLYDSVARLSPLLAQEIQASNFQPSERLLKTFLESLSKDSYYLHLLDRHPVVTRYTLRILELSPFLSEALVHNPNLIDEILQIADRPGIRLAFEALAPPLSDIEGLRRFYRREMFRILVSSICLAESVFQTLDRTSGLAEFLIARAYRVALEQALAHAREHATESKPFEQPQGELMVVALGRLGLREFDLGSDADLLFIIPDSESPRLQFWTRVAEHVIEILTAYTGDGPILSIDTRLRPNGREGMLVQSESSYFDYFSNRAEAWEGIAYMKARAVAGDGERAITFLTELQQVDWRRYGQGGGRSRQDLRQMRVRLQREQGPLTPLKAAEGGYYDADFILMYLRLKGAGLFFKSLNTPERIDIVEKMGHLERQDAELLLEATTFFRAIDHAQRIVTGRAEERLPTSSAERDVLAALVRLWSPKHVTGATLGEELQTLQRKVRRLFDTVFS